MLSNWNSSLLCHGVKRRPGHILLRWEKTCSSVHNSIFPGRSAVKKLPSNTGDARDEGLIPGLGRSPGVGNGNLFQYSCLENSIWRRRLVGYSPRDRRVRHSRVQQQQCTQFQVSLHFTCTFWLPISLKLLVNFDPWMKNIGDRQGGLVFPSL